MIVQMIVQMILLINIHFSLNDKALRAFLNSKISMFRSIFLNIDILCNYYTKGGFCYEASI